MKYVVAWLIWCAAVTLVFWAFGWNPTERGLASGILSLIWITLGVGYVCIYSKDAQE